MGSVIGNILLVMGAAMVVGGLPREKQTFSQTAANAQSAMLMLALAALIFPAIFQLIHGGVSRRGRGAGRLRLGPGSCRSASLICC